MPYDSGYRYIALLSQLFLGIILLALVLITGMFTYYQVCWSGMGRRGMLLVVICIHVSHNAYHDVLVYCACDHLHVPQSVHVHVQLEQHKKTHFLITTCGLTSVS